MLRIVPISFSWLLVVAATLTAADPAPRVLALGDSYTIGEAVEAAQRWPAQLARRLAGLGAACAEPEIIATTGWTTRDLLAALDARAPRGPYALVTVQIGVNDQYRGGDAETYRRDLITVLRAAAALAGARADHVLVLSIPDWGMTPFARGRDRAAISAAIAAFNQVSRDEARRQGMRYADVTPSSREALEDARLIAGDGLHPSAAMYAAWVELLAPQARAILAAP